MDGSRQPDGAPPALTEPAALHASGMLLVGAADRDAGKTEFACTLLRRAAIRHEVVAIKVTTVHDHVGPCPRGGQGCGLCSALTAPFEISEEHGSASGKDTVRLLECGARRVFWLRARRAAILDGVRALLQQIGARTLCVCESNSVRQVLEPGLFFLVRKEGTEGFKASAAAVAALADVEVLSDGRRFSPSPAELRVVDGPRWAWRQPATAIVLADGRRWPGGVDGAPPCIDGRPSLERLVRQLEPYFAEILVSAAEPDRYSFLGQRVVADRAPERGPWPGIVAALAASAHELNLVVPGDLPDLPLRLALRLLRAARGAEGAVPVTADGRREPLFAVYRRRILAPLETALAMGATGIVDPCAGLALRGVALPWRRDP